MLILAIDSCGSSCAVCLWQDGRVLAQEIEIMDRGQDARLIPLILKVMEKSAKTFSMLDKIAVTRGPGSFTGVRVGLAAARGLGLASAKPVIGVDRFLIYKYLHNRKDQNLLVVIASKRAELFCKFFPARGKAHDARLMTEEDIKTFIAQNVNTAIVRDSATVDDTTITACASLAAEAASDDLQFLPRPLYLRAPDVTVSSR